MTSKYYFKDVTLLITHYNRSGSLEMLLASFESLGIAFEDIVVSDDASQSEHLKKIADLRLVYKFRLIGTEHNGGLGNNINKGQAAVKTTFTLYVQEDFVPLEKFGEKFLLGFEMLKEKPDLDIVRFYSYIKYPHLNPVRHNFSEMIYKRWSLNYRKIYFYSDHPHLRRSNFIEKFGQYTEGVSVDRSEYRMCISFIQQKGKGLFFNDYLSLFEQRNPEQEPSTFKRNFLTVSNNIFIKLSRDFYRQLRYNYDLRFLRTNHGFAIKSDIAKLREKRNFLNDFLKAVLAKFLSLAVKIRYPTVEREYRQFYKDTIYCKLMQLKYIVTDYITKKPYKKITFNGEFAPELQFALPFAYWHYKNGTLLETTSSRFSKEFYFFSENHQENNGGRTNEGNYNFEIPRILYSQDYDIRKWAQVPLKEHYQNDIYKFDKPVLIIANRYNMEWGEPPISFLSIPVLDEIIKKLKINYTIVYNRPGGKNITVDDSELYDLGEFEWLRKEHPEVILMEDLYLENRAEANNFNHLQLMVYANASHFISTHGGTATLASYFGGTNLILSRKGPEHHFNCYSRLYPRLSGCKVLHAKDDAELMEHVNLHFLKPKANEDF